jgi:hypothetical protein
VLVHITALEVVAVQLIPSVLLLLLLLLLLHCCRLACDGRSDDPACSTNADPVQATFIAAGVLQDCTVSGHTINALGSVSPAL